MLVRDPDDARAERRLTRARSSRDVPFEATTTASPVCDVACAGVFEGKLDLGVGALERELRDALDGCAAEEGAVAHEREPWAC